MRRAADRHLAVSTWLWLLHGYALIERELRRAVAEHCTFPQFDVLSQLDRERDGLTFVELSRRLLVTAGNLTANLGVRYDHHTLPVKDCAGSRVDSAR